MSLFNHFMEKDIRKMACGQRESKFFSAENADVSEERLEHLLKTVRQSATGSAVLDEAEDSRTSIRFEKAKDSVGFYDPGKNCIFLNPCYADDLLLSVLVHEARHAWQGRRFIPMTTSSKPKSFMMVGFAMEADACATQAKFAYEMRETHPQIMEAFKEGTYAKVGEAFEKGIESGKEATALSEAFQAWYKTPAIEKYGDCYVDILAKAAESNASYLFRREVPALNIVTSLCKLDRRTGYLSDPQVLESPDRLFLKEATKERLESVIGGWSKSQYNPEPVVTGLKEIAVKKPDGTISMPKKADEKTVAVLRSRDGGR